MHLWLIHKLSYFKCVETGFLIDSAWYSKKFCNPFPNQHTCGVTVKKNIAKSGICASQFLPSSTSCLALCLSPSLSVYSNHSWETTYLVPAFECYVLQIIWNAFFKISMSGSASIGPVVTSTYWLSACPFEYLKVNMSGILFVIAFDEQFSISKNTCAWEHNLLLCRKDCTIYI